MKSITNFYTKHLKSIFFIILLFSFGFLNARLPRKNISTDFTDAERKEMCELLSGWIDQALITMHGNQSTFASIHTSNGFLSWHRDHFMDLENYLLENGGSKYVPFPKWDPSTPVPSYFNGFEPNGVTPYNNVDPDCSQCLGIQRENYKLLTLNDPLRSLTFPIAGNPSYTGLLPANICITANLNNVTNFSEIAEQYHNRVHVSFDAIDPNGVGSFMGNSSIFNGAAACYIFWAWHAWLDDIWFNWENCRKTSSNAYTDPNGLLLVKGTPVIINTPGIVKKYQGKIIVNPGCSLTISSGQIIEMLDDYYANNDGGIIVEKGNGIDPGGVLIIENGAIIRGITRMGLSTGDANEQFGATLVGGVFSGGDRTAYYRTPWVGITVKGDATKSATDLQQGRVIINGSNTNYVRLVFARTAITSLNGGIITAKFVKFVNCSTAVDIRDYIDPIDPSSNPCSFFNCEFKWNDKTLPARRKDNLTGQTEDDIDATGYYMHRLHPYHDAVHVRLTNVNNVDFGGCKFLNNDPAIFVNTAGHDDTRGIGILAVNASFATHNDGTLTFDGGCPKFNGANGCEFTGLSMGIQTLDPLQHTVGAKLIVDNTVFTDCHHSIDLNSNEIIRIQNSTFSYTATAKFSITGPSLHHHFIVMTNVKDYIINENTFSNASGPITASIEIGNANPLSPTQLNTTLRKIYLNTFTNSFLPSNDVTGIQLSGFCNLTQIACNTFNNYGNDIWLTGGVISDQGSLTNAANNKATKNGLQSGILIYNQGGILFSYFNDIINSMPPTYAGAAAINKNATSPFFSCQSLTCTGFPSGIRSLSKTNNISIYPNPCSKFSNIRVSDLNVTRIKIYSIDGRLCYENNIDNSKTITIDLSIFSNGIYCVNLYDNENLVGTKKLSVIK